MRKIFILGGSNLQLDLILEAKKMFFYVVVLDINKECIGSKWCDEFLHIDISDKEVVLQKAKEYKIDTILTSATELGNITACYVGEKLGLKTNSYETSLLTTDKILMKNILIHNNINTANFKVLDEEKKLEWNLFPCIIKPSDSSAGRGLSYCIDKYCLDIALIKSFTHSKTKKVLVEEYIEGEQYSIETISCEGIHQIIAINREYINEIPNIMEIGHLLPIKFNEEMNKNIEHLISKTLDAFNIKYGACHIEIKIKGNREIYVIELASRTGGMRTEMINFSLGINYSQLLLMSSLGIQPKLNNLKYSQVKCNFVLNYKSYLEYLMLKKNPNLIIFEPFEIKFVEKIFQAEHIGQSKGYYFILEKAGIK